MALSIYPRDDDDDHLCVRAAARASYSTPDSESFHMRILLTAQTKTTVFST